MEHIACHLCASTEVHHCGDKYGHALYVCEACRLMFVHPIPDDLSQIYSESYFRDTGKGSFGYSDYDKDKEPMKDVFVRFLRKFEGLTEGRTLCDVGAATGYFLDLAKGRGWHTSGVELSVYAAGVASQRGHAMQVGELPTLLFSSPVSVMTMWDVLEHVRDPRAYVEAAARLIAPGGILAINTVDTGSLFARVMGMRWHLIVPPEHLHYYNAQNLSDLLHTCGFEVLEVSKAGKKFSPAYVAKTLARWQGERFWGPIAHFFERGIFRHFSLPINLRDNMFVIARRRAGVETIV